MRDLVLVQEEYGYKMLVGQLNMSVEQFVKWWESLEIVTTQFPFPLMEMEDIEEDDDAPLAKWSWTDEQGQQHILDRSKVAIFCKVHEDYDSHIKVVEGDVHFHKGYKEFEVE